MVPGPPETRDSETNISEWPCGVADNNDKQPCGNAPKNPSDSGIRPFLFTDLDTYRGLYNCTLLN